MGGAFDFLSGMLGSASRNIQTTLPLMNRALSTLETQTNRSFQKTRTQTQRGFQWIKTQYRNQQNWMRTENRKVAREYKRSLDDAEKAAEKSNKKIKESTQETLGSLAKLFQGTKGLITGAAAGIGAAYTSSQLQQVSDRADTLLERLNEGITSMGVNSKNAKNQLLQMVTQLANSLRKGTGGAYGLDETIADMLQVQKATGLTINDLPVLRKITEESALAKAAFGEVVDEYAKLLKMMQKTGLYTGKTMPELRESLYRYRGLWGMSEMQVQEVLGGMTPHLQTVFGFVSGGKQRRDFVQNYMMSSMMMQKMGIQSPDAWMTKLLEGAFNPASEEFKSITQFTGIRGQDLRKALMKGGGDFSVLAYQILTRLGRAANAPGNYKGLLEGFGAEDVDILRAFTDKENAKAFKEVSDSLVGSFGILGDKNIGNMQQFNKMLEQWRTPKTTQFKNFLETLPGVGNLIMWVDSLDPFKTAAIFAMVTTAVKGIVDIFGKLFRGGGFFAKMAGGAALFSKSPLMMGLMKRGGLIGVIGTLLMGALDAYRKTGVARGQALVTTGISAAGTGIGAWIGTMILPGIGTIVGGFLGNWIAKWVSGSFAEPIRSAFDRAEVILLRGRDRINRFFGDIVQGILDKFNTLMEKLGLKKKEPERPSGPMPLWMNMWLGTKPGGGAAPAGKGSPAKKPGGNLTSIFQAASARYGVPIHLLLGLARQESGFNQGARSGAGAIGVMQLMPGTARGLGVDPFNVYENIMGGAKYFGGLLRRFGGDPVKALWAYNAGPKAVGRYMPAETRTHIQKVMGYASQYQNIPKGAVPTPVSMPNPAELGGYRSDPAFMRRMGIPVSSAAVAPPGQEAVVSAINQLSGNLLAVLQQLAVNPALAKMTIGDLVHSYAGK